MESPFVLAIGEALIDAVSTSFVDDLSQARELELKPGGSPANFCRFLNQLGTPAKLVAALGNDGLAKIILGDMHSKGIDTSQVQQVPDHATTIILVGKSKGTPDFLPYRGADQHIRPVDTELISQCSVVHSTAFALSREPAQSNILTAMHRAKEDGRQISVDWNYAEKIWGSSNNAKEIFNEITRLNPLLKFSLDDAERFTGQQLDAPAAMQFLEQFDSSVTCLTCGADGVWYRKQQQAWLHAEAKPVQVKDSTGAGDSFWAGFIHAWLRDAPLHACIDNALETAAKRLEGFL